MTQTAILYYSKHHGNTQKVIETIQTQHEVDLFPIEDQNQLHLEQYSKIGFASGIYMSQMQSSLLKYVEEHQKELQNKETFVIATGGANSKKRINAFSASLQEKNIKVVGTYYCFGYDTFGPFKLVGGIRKNHPTQAECDAAVTFFESL